MMSLSGRGLVVGLSTFAALMLSGQARATTEGEPLRSFGAIQQVFTQSCAFSTCHSAIARQGGLVLEHEDLSYASLVDHASDHPDAKASGMLRVKSGDPENSFLIRKLKGLGPGDQMPQGGGMLPEDVITMVEDWIRRGAHTKAEECVTREPTPTEGGQGQHGIHIDPTLCSDVPVQGEYTWEPEPPLEEPEPGDDFVQLYVPQRPVDPGTEWEICYAFRVKDLPNFDKVPSQVIKRQEYRMHEGSHHLLLYMYYGEHPEQFAEGFFPCSAGNCINDEDCPEDQGGSQFPIGGTQVAGTRYIVSYPNGVGLPLLNPNNAVLIANLHYTNPFQPPQNVYAEAWLNLYFHQPGDLKVILDGIFAINAGDLIVEPYATKTISRVWRPRGFLGTGPKDAAVFQLFGHMHKRGRLFKIDWVDRLCTGDCNEDNTVSVDELVSGVNVILGSAPMNRCRALDVNLDNAATVDEMVGAVGVALNGCSRLPDAEIYRTNSWDSAPVQEYPAPYLEVDKNQGLRWTCTHENGRLIEGPEGTMIEDPTYPAKKCRRGCRVCGWSEETQRCTFTRDRSNRQYEDGEPMPLAFGELADDDMCNMFGYFIGQSDVPLIAP